jgi:hypothetical protein
MEMPKQATIDNAIKLLGEVFVPGASLLMDGKIVSGSAHLIVGTWAKAAIGPVGLAIVVANSFSESATGMNLLKHFSKLAQDVQGGPVTPAPSPSPSQG